MFIIHMPMLMNWFPLSAKHKWPYMFPMFVLIPTFGASAEYPTSDFPESPMDST